MRVEQRELVELGRVAVGGFVCLDCVAQRVAAEVHSFAEGDAVRQALERVVPDRAADEGVMGGAVRHHPIDVAKCVFAVAALPGCDAGLVEDEGRVA